MDLHIKDRLLIPSIFPERGNFMDFNLKKSIARKIAISEQDRKDYEIVEKKEEKRIEWNVQKDAETPLVVEFSKEELRNNIFIFFIISRIINNNCSNYI